MLDLTRGRLGPLVIVLTAVSVAVTLSVVAAVLSPSSSGPPVQQWGTAAGLSHRAPPAVGTVVNGKVVHEKPPRSAPARAARMAAALRAVHPPKGAVPPASKPPRVRFRAGKRSRDSVRTLPRPPAPAVRGFSPRSSRLIPAQTSASRVVYQNADGTRTARLFSQPVNYRRPDGSWAPISTSLVPVGGTGVAPSPPASGSSSPSPSGDLSSSPAPSYSSSAVPSAAATPTPKRTSAAQAPRGWREDAEARPETFAAYADGRPLLVLPLSGSRSAGVGVLDAAPAPGTASGDAVTYAGVRPDAGLRLVAGTGQADLQVVLDSRGAPRTWVFPLRLDGLTARGGPDGAVQFTTASGQVVATMPRGLMTDSKINPRSGDGAQSDGVSYALTTAGGQPAIRMTLDSAWLDAKSRVFPVTVDPAVISGGGTTYVENDSTSDNSGGVEIKAGTFNGGTTVARSLLNFGVPASLTNDTVLGAQLGLFNTWSYSCSARPVSVYPVTGPWATSATWPGPSIGPAIGTKSFATGWVPLGSSVSPCPSAWEGIPVSAAGTRMINGWTHGTTPDYGLAVGASSSDSYGWKKFSSDNTSADPSLSVTYTPFGASYKLASSQPVQQITPKQNGQIKITVTNTGSQTWTSSNGYELSYEVYNAQGKRVAVSPQPFTAIPAGTTVPANGHVTLNATVDALPVGDYVIDFDMYASANTASPESFLSQGISTFAINLHVPQPPPVVTAVYPPTGFVSPTVTPELSTSAFSTISTPITYQFTLECQPLPGTTCPASTITSGPGWPTPYWVPSQALAWNQEYTWTVTATTNNVSTTVGPVTITPEVPQPGITSELGAAAGQAFDPQSGNFTTTATDAALAVPGPALQLTRTYNSLDPRASGAFGAGWWSMLDASVTPDSDGSGSVVVALPDGQEMRFGYNASTGTYAPPMGSPDQLVHNSGGTWTLVDGSGSQYGFTSGGTIQQITSSRGLTQLFTPSTSSPGEVTAITDHTSGRSLSFTWGKPAGAAYSHVTSVTSTSPVSGQTGPTWTYSYTGDELTGVCNPSGNCTSYTYGSGSDYRTAVLDSGPRDYWQLGDAPPPNTTPATTPPPAADEVDVNLGTTSGTYSSSVALGQPGPLAGSSETAAGFNGTSSSVSLPANVISDQDYVSIGLWFKAASSTASGVLFGYAADALSNSSGNSAAHVPALYVGGNGELYGELWNGSIDPMHSPASVDDGNWHYAMITGSATSQTLWLDGTQVATLSGQISPDGLINDTVGAGFWQSWPQAYVTEGPSLVDTPIGYFDGSIGQVGVYPHPLGQAAITQQYALARTASAELTQVTLPSGRVYQQAAYDPAQDRLTTYTDPSGGQWQISAPLTTGYKASPDALEEATRSVNVTTPAGYTQVYGYDAVNGGQLVSFTPGNGDPPETFGYDAAGFLNQVQDSDGDLFTFTNDIHGNVLSRTWYPTEPASVAAARPAGLPGPRAGPKAASTTASSYCTVTLAACTTYYTYYYNQASPTDPRNDLLTGMADARSASATDTTYLTTYAYNTAGQLISSTTPPTSDFPSGRTTSYTYSTASAAAYGGSGTIPASLLVSKTTPGGATTSYSYYSDGDLAEVTQPSGSTTVYTYDQAGRPQKATTTSDTYPGGLTTSYTWTADSQQATVTFPGVVNHVTGVTHTRQDSYAYNADGNLLSLTETDTTGGDATRVTGYTYNDHGEVASVTQPGGATSGGTAPSQGAPSPDPAGATTGYSYNDSGLVSTMTDPDGNEYDYAYNEYGKVTQVTLTTNSTSPSLPAGGSSLVLDSYAYDAAGRLQSVTDAMGRQATFQYDGNNELIQSQVGPSGSGRMTTYSYDPAGNLSETDVSSNPLTTADQDITTYNYDAASRLASMVTGAIPSGASGSEYPDRTTSYSYNADNEVTSQTVNGIDGPATTNYGYNSADEQTSQSVVNGSASDTTTWTYDQLGQPVSMTTPDGNASGATAASFTTSYAYDQAGNLDQMTGPPVATVSYAAQDPATTRPVTSYGYDTFGDQTQTVDPNLNTTTATYDGSGQVVTYAQPSYTPPGASSPVTALTRYGYDENGNPTSVTDPAGDTTSYTYDALGDQTSETDPQLTGQSAPGVWTWTYDNDGDPLSATTPTGAQTRATYDAFGDQDTTTQVMRTSSGSAQDNTTHYTYDYLGDPLTATTPDGAATTSTYDTLGELTSTADSYGDTTSYAYDYAGWLAEIINPDATSEDFGYDGNGNLTSATDYGASAEQGELPPVLATQTMAYDPSGNLVSSKDANGVTTTMAYNAAGELTSQTQPVSSSASDVTSYGYDPAGNQTSVTGGRQNTTWTTYNSWNLPESVIEPATATATTAAQRTWTTAYDADGRPAAVTQPGGVTLSYGYDQAGDLTSESGSGAAATTPAQSFGYDLAGELTSATAPGGTDTFGYNDAGQVTSTAGPSGSSTFGYNADGLMTSRTDRAGTTSYTYDNADRLATVADPLTGATLSYGYNADSLPATISYSPAPQVGVSQALGYTGLHQLASDTLTAASGATIASQSYGYDPDGNLTSAATSGFAGAGSTTYGNNQAGELTSSTTGGTTTSYGYDADGNLTQAGGTSYTYNAQDQPASSASSAGTTSYGYTPSGTLSSVTPPSGSTQAYTSDAYGQTMTAPGGISYGYDGLGRLVTRTTGSGTTDFAYSGTGGTVASDGTTSYTYDPSGNPVAGQPSGGAAQAMLTDVHGDVTGTFSPASSTTSLTASASYSPYGSVTASSGTMPSLGYQDQYTDPSTGSTDMSARWYAPSTGTFTSSDTTATGMPQPSAVGGTPYGYVNGDPLTSTDPTGHCSMNPFTGLVGYLACLAAEKLFGSGSGGGGSLGRGVGGGGGGGGNMDRGVGAWGTMGRGGGSASDNSYGYGGGGGCGGCGYSPPPAPPPPPPQDCYEAQTCAPPPAPPWLRDFPIIKIPPINITLPQLVPLIHTIFQTFRREPPPDGTEPEPNPAPQEPTKCPDTGQPAPPEQPAPPGGEPAPPGGEPEPPGQQPQTGDEPLIPPCSAPDFSQDPWNQEKCLKNPPGTIIPNPYFYAPLVPVTINGNTTQPQVEERASGATACLTRIPYPIDKKTPPRTPPGFEPYMNRGHLIARTLGGSNTLFENFVPLYPSPNRFMENDERRIQKAVDAGQTIWFEVIPLFNSNNPLIPYAVQLYAEGNKGYSLHVTILNPRPPNFPAQRRWP